MLLHITYNIILMVTVLRKLVFAQKASILEHPKNATVLEGSDVQLNCVFDNVPINAYIQWVSGDGQGGVDTTGYHGPLVVKKSNYERSDIADIEWRGDESIGEYHILIKNVSWQNHGGKWFECQHTRALRSQPSTLTVLVPPPKLEIVPFSPDGILHVLPGQSLNLTCTTHNSYPPAELSWSAGEVKCSDTLNWAWQTNIANVNHQHLWNSASSFVYTMPNYTSTDGMFEQTEILVKCSSQFGGLKLSNSYLLRTEPTRPQEKITIYTNQASSDFKTLYVALSCGVVAMVLCVVIVYLYRRCKHPNGGAKEQSEHVQIESADFSPKPEYISMSPCTSSTSQHHQKMSRAPVVSTSRACSCQDNTSSVNSDKMSSIAPPRSADYNFSLQNAGFCDIPQNCLECSNTSHSTRSCEGIRVVSISHQPNYPPELSNPLPSACSCEFSDLPPIPPPMMSMSTENYGTLPRNRVSISDDSGGTLV